MALAAHNGADRADQMIALTQRLSNLVTAETQALRAGKLDASSSEWAEKEKLAHAYRLEMQAIRANPALLDGASADQKADLMQAAQSLQTLLESHAKALDAMKGVTEGLVKAITEEAADKRAGPRGYGVNGALANAPRSAGSGLAADVKA